MVKAHPATYRIWTGMRQRCLNPASPPYHRYGGRGITICKRWDKFENFLADMGERPDGLSLDRIDNNKGYSPENCRWATRLVQGRNKENVIFLTYRGETRCLTEWADILGMSCGTIHHRIKYSKWSVERALSTRPIEGGRYLGADHGTIKFTPEQMSEIAEKVNSKKRYWGRDKLAAKFGVHFETILRVAKELQNV